MSLAPPVNSISKESFVKMAKLHNILRNLNFDKSQFNTRALGNGLYVSLGELPSSDEDEERSFRYTKNSNIVNIYPGTLRLHGTNNASVVSSDVIGSNNYSEVTLSDSSAWVYAQYHKVDKLLTIADTTVATIPEDDETYLKFPLYLFETANVASNSYSLTYDSYCGDIDLPAIGYTGKITQVIDTLWTAPNLEKVTKELTFENGILIEVSANTTSTIVTFASCYEA